MRNAKETFIALGKLYEKTHSRCSSGYCKMSCGVWTFGWDYKDKYYFKFGSYCLSVGSGDRWAEFYNDDPEQLVKELKEKFEQEESYTEGPASGNKE